MVRRVLWLARPMVSSRHGRSVVIHSPPINSDKARKESSCLSPAECSAVLAQHIVSDLKSFHALAFHVHVFAGTWYFL